MKPDNIHCRRNFPNKNLVILLRGNLQFSAEFSINPNLPMYS